MEVEVLLLETNKILEVERLEFRESIIFSELRILSGMSEAAPYQRFYVPLYVPSDSRSE